MFTMTKLFNRSALVPATAFAAALMLAACGSGGGSSSSGSSSPNNATPDGYWSGSLVYSATDANTLGGIILKDSRFWLIESSRISSSGSSTIFGMFTGTMSSSYNSQTNKYEFSTATSTYFQNPIGSTGVVASPTKLDLPLKGEFVAATSMTGFVYNVSLSFPAGCAVINQAPGAAYSGIALTESGSSRLTLALVRTDQNQALFLLFDR